MGFQTIGTDSTSIAFMFKRPTTASTWIMPQFKVRPKGSGLGELWNPSRSGKLLQTNLDSSLFLPMVWNPILK